MKVTHELLSRFDSDFSLHEFIDKYGRVGAEPIDLMLHDPAPSLEQLHWIKRFFDLTDTEKARYFQLCGIEDSNHVYGSNQVLMSEYVSASSNVTKSENVFDGENISYSNHIYTCADVSNSSDIVFSRHVSKSQFIFNSENIEFSHDVFRGSDIKWSNFISFCERVEDSSFVYRSNDCYRSHFLGFSSRCTNCLFSTNLQGAEWFIFNEPVAIKDYVRVEEEMNWKLDEVTDHIAKVDPKVSSAVKRYTGYNRLDAIFDVLGAEFFGWVGTLPNYSEEKFLNLFFSTKFFTNQKLEKV